jgi:hypothetical protein
MKELSKTGEMAKIFCFHALKGPFNDGRISLTAQ